jgi:hypothetical protein
MPEVAFSEHHQILIVNVMILHYLTSAGAEPPAQGRYTSFSGIPGGMFYVASFQRRALDMLLTRFGENPDALVKAGISFGGSRWDTGDYAVSVPVLPRITLVFQIFEGDDEFPAEANILFPDNIGSFLPVEDTAFLGGYVVGALARAR